MKVDKRTTRICDYHGAKNPNAKLTEDDVIWARRAYRAGIKPIKIARLLDTSKSNICNIVARRTWKKCS